MLARLGHWFVALFDRLFPDAGPWLGRRWAACRWLTRRVFDGPAWFLWALALALTWVGYVTLNCLFSATHFAHLDRPAPPTVAEWQRLSRIGFGASRAEWPAGNDAPPTPRATAELTKDLIVLRGPYTRLFARSGEAVVPRLTAGEVNDARLLLEAELNGTDYRPPERRDRLPDREAVVEHLKLQLQLLRLRHLFLTPDTVDEIRHGRLPKLTGPQGANARALCDAEDGFWKLDPLAGDADALRTAVAEYQQRVRQAQTGLAPAGCGSRLPQVGEDWTAGSLEAESVSRSRAQAKYLSDVSRLVPFDANRQLALVPVAASADPPTAFTVVYFPTTRQAVNPTKPTAGDAKPAGETVTPAGYVYAMEVAGVGGWWEGRRWQARFVLVSTAVNRPAYPLISPRSPATDVVTRGPGWLGFRPSAVLVSEEQLAARFFPELEELQSGSGIKGSLAPTDDTLVAQSTAFVRAVLARTLGHPPARPQPGPQSPAAITETEWLPPQEATNAGPDGQFPRAEAVDEWIVWPRRLNGGTAWGFIQFVVVFMAVRFILEFVAVRREVRWTEAALRPSPVGPTLPVAVAVRRLNTRTHTLRAIVAALPLVGFLGTVAGLSNSLIGAAGVSSDSPTQRQSALQAMEIALGTAFDKSMLAFAAAILCTFLERWMGWRIQRLADTLR